MPDMLASFWKQSSREPLSPEDCSVDHEVVGIQVGLPAPVTDGQGRTFTSAIKKRPVEGPVHVGAVNIEGDEQADLRLHGGPDKAVCVYPAAHLAYWRDLLYRPALGHGDFGENLSVAGVTENDVAVGDTLAVGTALLQISQPRSPCWKLARRWEHESLALEVQRTGYTGWYLRVLEQGEIEVGQRLRLIQRPHPDLTVATVHRARWHDRDDLDLASALAGNDALSISWRDHFRARLEGGREQGSKSRLHNRRP